MKNEQKKFRDWLKKTHGIQEHYNYAGTQCEGFAIEYSTSLIKELEKNLATMTGQWSKAQSVIGTKIERIKELEEELMDAKSFIKELLNQK
jgi:hypothetical protein